MKKVQSLYLLAFLSAFLLFQIELVVAKLFLPKFGGSYLVWGACVVFFQFALLLGYLYAHLAIRRFGMYRYRYVHLILLFLPLLFFPGRPLPEINVHEGLPLVMDIFLQLLLTIGLAFFALSTISLITQSWLSRSDLPEHRNPFVLYAVSNVGSFLGLLSYPFLFERFFDLETQLVIWRVLYFLFLAAYLLALRTVDYSSREVPEGRFFERGLFTRRFSIDDPAVRQRLYWFLLSAAGCVLFLSVTNVITYEIAPCPLLWIIPLCLYLLSFVLTFRDRPLVPTWLTDRFHLVMGFSVVIYFFAGGRILPISPQLIAFLASLFLLCLFCQHELYRSRPLEKGALTGFYLIISLGGFAGSALVTWLAPVLFTQTLEFLLGLFLIALSLGLKEGGHWRDVEGLRMVLYGLILIVAWPIVFTKYHVLGVLLIFWLFAALFNVLFRNKVLLTVALLALMIVAPYAEDYWGKEGKTIRVYRNYYGIYKISATPGLLRLLNGSTLHGAQFLTTDPIRRQEPLTYYHRQTPVGKVLESGLFKTDRMAVVGLGVGTLSAYGRPGGQIDFFELDPGLEAFVNVFDYLENSRAALSFFYDDARIALRKRPPKGYDLLIVDAFSGDSVPVHLLTTDAIREYRERITETGMILFHISNRYLDLEPVLASNARLVEAYAFHDHNAEQGAGHLASRWMVLTWNPQTSEALASRLGWQDSLLRQRASGLRPWTDQYSNIPAVMKLNAFSQSIKSFTPFAW